MLTARDELGPAEEPEIVEALAMLELQRRRFVRDRTQAIQRAAHHASRRRVPWTTALTKPRGRIG